jgi:hypothetical protein
VVVVEELSVLVEEEVHLVLGVVVALLCALGALLILFRRLVIHEMITNKFVSELLIYTHASAHPMYLWRKKRMRHHINDRRIS